MIKLGTDTNSVEIETVGAGYNYDIDCNDDGMIDATNLTSSYSCLYPTQGGVHTVRIIGSFPRMKFDWDFQPIEVIQWGSQQWTSMESAFAGSYQLMISASDTPDLTQVTDMSFMFTGCSNGVFNSSISNWDTSQVTSMMRLFSGVQNFNQPLNNWNTSAVTDMSWMFAGLKAKDLNLQIENWDTSNVIDMNHMFSNATYFNEDLGDWDTANVMDMSSMFDGAELFNQDISQWNVSQVENFFGMFWDAKEFNQNIGTWNTTKVKRMSFMFHNAHQFNQNIGSWNTGNVEDMHSMFDSAYVFNQDIGNWNTSKVKEMTFMFQEAYDFNQNIGNWNTTLLEDMFGMFLDANSFNQDISQWDTSKVTRLGYTFFGAGGDDFDQNIGEWNVSSLLTGGSMLAGSQKISTSYYDNLLANWSAQNLNDNVVISLGSSYFCYGLDDKTALINNYNWRLFDGNQHCLFVEFGPDTNDNFITGNNLPRIVIKGEVIDKASVIIRDTLLGTASEGIDYQFSANQIINIPRDIYDGGLSQSIEIPGLQILENAAIENEKTIIFELINPRGESSIGDADGDLQNKQFVAYVIRGQGQVQSVPIPHIPLFLVILILATVFIKRPIK
ncbi:BspA family leucine-rich repeat surface protein [Marinicella marina]|uniref:BspA family leucine-rich repeat surface protein n=1 Tax=Marinicella marina TaxID=2996016 RepID=UPI0024BCA235|nr:BspA family leucine-rich repeat surface protein [Marinicella marina]MDJ1139252.1 BspA family leucine-rich repeat surface protein [Marinicella marina]